MEDKEINKVFKQTLKVFLKEMLDTSDSFVDEIERCDTYYELKDLLEVNVEDIFLKLGGDNKCYECQEKDDKIDELEDSVDELSNENDEMLDELSKGFNPETLDDEYKIEAFKAAKDKFSVSEMESLLS